MNEQDPSAQAGDARFPAGSGNGSRPAPRERSGYVTHDEQMLAEVDQSVSEIAQTLADTDQSASDSDQTSAERDQAASDSDQAASDHDLARGADRVAHEITRSIRERSTRQREQTARERLRVAEQRDAVADLRDLAALARDRAADARDAAMGRLDDAAEAYDSSRALTGIELVARAAEQRKRAALHRAHAASHRLLAAEDRQAAARDRQRAEQERHQAMADREALTKELERAAFDGLTGARTRTAGLDDLDHEVERARRTGGSLVVSYIDVVGLKAINDTRGHAAGDALLRRMVLQIKACVRPYDLIIRLGGDEFLCVMSNLTVAAARERFDAIAAALRRASDPGAIRTGFAELGEHESASELIARADSELIRRLR